MKQESPTVWPGILACSRDGNNGSEANKQTEVLHVNHIEEEDVYPDIEFEMPLK
jgi:hypothetical protein